MPAPKKPELFRDKVILAPMVRAGRTSLRLQCLEYGASLVYTEEIIDQKLLAYVLGTVDYTNEDEVVLRIATKKERDRLVLQIGTNSAEGAAAVAKLIEQDVAAIDVNMGCPKPFSISGGMGAALLTQPDKVRQILTSLVEAAQVPVTCKIRLRDQREDTIQLARVIQDCGVSALGVHGRRRDERNPDRCRCEEIAEVARALDIPVIANGGSGQIVKVENIEAFRKKCEASSVMIARVALSTPSIFSSTLQRCSYELEACEYDEGFTGTKYVVQRMLGGEQEHDPRGKATVAAGSCAEICAAWSLQETYERWRSVRQRLGHKRKLETCPETGTCTVDVTFPIKKLKDCSSTTPKCILHKLCDTAGDARPQYTTTKREADSRFITCVSVRGRRFQSPRGQTNKKMAEQVAALAALIGLGLRDKLPGDWENS